MPGSGSGGRSDPGFWIQEGFPSVDNELKRNVSRRSLLKATGAVGPGSDRGPDLRGLQLDAVVVPVSLGAAPTTAPRRAHHRTRRRTHDGRGAHDGRRRAPPPLPRPRHHQLRRRRHAERHLVELGSSSEAFQNAISQINTQFKQKQPNVTDQLRAARPGRDVDAGQTSRIASQTTDITANYGFAPQDIINFQPDSQFLDLSGLPSLKNFDQTNIERFMTWKGKVWQMTLAYVGHIVWTNQDMLDKYDLKAPTTYAEWTGDVRHAQVQGRNAHPVRGQAVDRAHPLHEHARDERRCDPSTRTSGPTCWSGQGGLHHARVDRHVRRAKEFVNKEFDPAFSGIDYPTSAGMFATGKYAMWPEGSFSGGDIRPPSRRSRSWARSMRPSPTTPTANAVQPVYGDISWSGLRYSKNSDVVLRLDRLLRPEGELPELHAGAPVLPDAGAFS